MTDSDRRPLKSRNTRWAAAGTRLLVRMSVPPNHISIASVIAACMAGASLVSVHIVSAPLASISLYVAAALFIQVRLLCNLFDGLVAVEGGRMSKSGQVFNDLPDRISDAVILICAGYSVPIAGFHGIELGFIAALLALVTAYVRVLGVACGTPHYFVGPMAKPHRMAVITAACILSAVEPFTRLRGWAMFAALVLVALGCVVTILRRTRLVLRWLNSQ